LIFDTRSLYDYLKSHVNYNFKSDHTIPLPSDFILENDLDVCKYSDWLPNLMMKDPYLQSIGVVNDK
jgi:hypothetical protein